MQLLERAKAEIGANESDLNKLELVQTLKEVRLVFLLWQSLGSYCVLYVQERERQTSGRPREVAELQRQLQSKERERESL